MKNKNKIWAHCFLLTSMLGLALPANAQVSSCVGIECFPVISNDKDSDGILDSNESPKSCSIKTANTSFSENFGTGEGAVENSEVPSELEFSSIYKKTDGWYMVTDKVPVQHNGVWLAGKTDHTGDKNGRMLVLNPGYASKTLYVKKITNTKADQQLDISAWFLNLLNQNAPTDAISPTIRFELWDKDNTERLQSGDWQLITKDYNWHKGMASFTGTGGDVYIKIVLKNTQVSGVDIAIDDISVAQSFCDADLDGIANHLDTDSDGDGCLDQYERDGDNIGTSQIAEQLTYNETESQTIKVYAGGSAKLKLTGKGLSTTTYKNGNKGEPDYSAGENTSNELKHLWYIQKGEIPFSKIENSHRTGPNTDWQVLNVTKEMDGWRYKAKMQGKNNRCAVSSKTFILKVVEKESTSTNTKPYATDDVFETSKNTSITFSVKSLLANDGDKDGELDPKSFVITSKPETAKGTLTELMLSEQKYLRYTPAGNVFGNNSFTYKVCNKDQKPLCVTATVTIKVGGQDTGLVVLDDTATTVKNTAIDINVLLNDRDDDSNIAISQFTQPSHGTVKKSTQGNSLIYMPAYDWSGIDNFKYTVCNDDSTPVCKSANVRVITNGYIFKDSFEAIQPVSDDNHSSAQGLPSKTAQ